MSDESLRGIIRSLIDTYGALRVEEQFTTVREEVVKEYISVLTKYGYTVGCPGATGALKEPPTAAVETPAVEPISESVTATEPVPAPDATPLSVVEVKQITCTSPEPKSTYNRLQRQKEKEKQIALKEAGATPATLLTIENVQGWLDEGHSFAWIAREKIGCKQEIVSTFAKLNNLKRKGAKVPTS